MPVTKARLQGFYKYLPGREAVTLYPRAATSSANADDFATGVATPQARRRPISEEESKATGITTSEGISWSIWDTGQSAFPNDEDVIQDGAGARYTVKRVKKTILGNLYACVCVKEK